MNTPAHAVLNLALLGSGSGRGQTRPIFWGALTPDLPMLLFYLWERLFMGVSERVIWSESYFEAHWQDFFDVFNSIPIAGVALALCWQLRRAGGVAFFASMLLHQAMDLPLHREDAHRHFLPFSEFRFESPVSYWDPTRFGAWASLAEAGLVLACAALMWQRYPTRWPRAVLAGLALLQFAVWFFFYGLGRLPAP